MDIVLASAIQYPESATRTYVSPLPEPLPIDLQNLQSKMYFSFSDSGEPVFSQSHISM